MLNFLKIVLVIIIFFAIVGGTIRFRDNSGEYYGILIDTQRIFSGVGDGAVKSYEYLADLIKDTGIFDSDPPADNNS